MVPKHRMRKKEVNGSLRFGISHANSANNSNSNICILSSLTAFKLALSSVGSENGTGC